MEPPENLVPAPSASKRPVKFVASDEDGLPLKRRQVQQACDSCRRKKKRCPHGTGSAGYPFIQDGPPSRPSAAWPQHSPTSQPSQPSQSSPPISRRPQQQQQQQHQQQQPQPPRRPVPNTSHPNPHPHPARLPLSPQSSEQNEDATSTRLVASHLVELSASRFVGDLSPERVFIEATSRNTRESRLHRNRSEVGTWMRDGPSGASTGRASGVTGDETGAGRGEHDADGSGSHGDAPEQALLTLGGRLVEQLSPEAAKSHLAVCPPDQDYQHLCAIYLENIHPILPILREADVLATRGPERLSTRQALLKQVISLASGVDPSCSKHLRLEGGGVGGSGAANAAACLSAQEFHQRLAKAVFATLDTNVVVDTVDRIRILLIMSLFYQPRHASGRDMSPLIFSQAVHHAQSIGIHLRKGSAEDDDAEGLFCAMSALDRMNAAFHGRPCLLHQRDTDREMDECIAKQKQPAFRLFLGVCKMLEKVICLYRPRNDGVESVELPVYESMIIDAGAERLPSRLLSTIEVFYHAVSVLSCRESSSTSAPSTPTTGHLPHPTINARRSLSADRIIDSVISSLSSPASSDSIFIMPFVPYAVALSLSVVYLKMRHSKIPMYRFRAKQRFREIVGLLQSMGELYTSARVNAGLGLAILREMDKTAKELATGTAGGNGGGLGAGGKNAGGGGAVSASSSAPVTRPQSKSVSPARQGSSSTSERHTGSGVDGGGAGGAAAAVQEEQQFAPVVTSSSTAAVRTSQHGIASAPSTAVAVLSTTREVMTPTSLASPTAQQAAAAAMAMGVGGAGHGHGHPQTVMTSNPDFTTPVSWGDVADIDLFVHFDPGFDLGAVDAALEANLDMGYPQLWNSPWPQ